MTNEQRGNWCTRGPLNPLRLSVLVLTGSPLWNINRLAKLFGQRWVWNTSHLDCFISKGPFFYQLSQGFKLKTGTKSFVSSHKGFPSWNPEEFAPCWMSEVLHRGVGDSIVTERISYYSPKRDQLFFFWPTSGPRSSTPYLKSHSHFDFASPFFFLEHTA